MDIARLGVEVQSGSVRRASQDLSAFNRHSRDAGQATETLGRKSSAIVGSVKSMAVQLAAAAGATAALTKAFSAAEQYTTMQNRLMALGASHESAAKQIQQLADISQNTRAPLQATSELYSRLSLTADSLGASQQDLMQFTETVGLALAASGTSAGQASGALTQLSQAMAGGVVRAEEFNSMIEGAPGLLMAVANGIEGVNGDLGALRQMMLDGELTSEQFFTALLSQNEALQASFEATSPTISQALTVMNDQFTLFIGSADQATGVTNTIAEAILMLAQNMDVAVPVFGAVAIGVAAITAPVLAAGVAIGGLAIAVITHWDEIKEAFNDGVDYVVGLGSRLVQALKDAGRLALDAALNIGVEIINGISAGIDRKFQELKDKITGLGVYLPEWLKDMLGIASPSKVFAEIGEWIVEGLGVGIIDNAYYATDAIGQMVDYMFDGFKDGMKGIVNIFVSTLKQMAAAALKNKITIGLGIGATGVGGAAMAGQGGGLLGNVGSLFGGGGFLGLGGGTGSIFGGAGLLGMGGGSGLFGLGAGSGLAGALGGGAFGAAASVALPVIGIGLALAGLFKKTEVLVAEGVRARIDGASLELDSYEKTKTDNAFGMSSGFSRDFDRLDDAVQSAVGARLNATIDALGAFGLGTDLTGFSFSKRTEIKEGETFEGESEEVIREALDAAITYLADGALDMFQQTGESLSDTLDRLTGSFNGVSESLYLLDQNLLPMTLQGADAASKLLELSGGLESFNEKVGFVFSNMLTEAEQQARLSAIAMDQLNATFDDLGQAIPDTRADFMDLLDAQDLTTSEGRRTYSALLDVAQAFVQVRGAAQSAAASVSSFDYSGEMRGVDSVFTARSRAADSALADAERALRAAFQAEETRIGNAYAKQIEAARASAKAAQAQSDAASQSVQERIQLRESIADALERAYRDRRVLDALGERSQLNAGTAFLRAAVNAGGTSDLLGLQTALDAVADPATALFKSFADYQQDFNVNTNLISELKDITDGQLSVEMRTLNGIEDTVNAVERSGDRQVSALESSRDAQLSAMSSQMNALLGIDTSVLSVEDAIRNLNLAQEAAEKASEATKPRDSGTEFTPGSIAAQINQLFIDELGRPGAQAGIEYYLGDYRDGQSLDDIRRSINNSAEGVRFDETGIPQYEGGGFTGYGSRSGGLDGRGGFMAMLHPNETVIDHTRQRGGGSASNNAEIVAELRELNQRVRYLQDKEKTMARILNDWNTNGQPAERVS